MIRSPPNASQAGFTLVELLVTLAMTAMIAVFVIAGLDLTRRGWTASRDRELPAEVDAGLARLRTLLSRGMPVTVVDETTRLARLLFDGDSHALTFVTSSEATAFRGGPMLVRLSWPNGAAGPDQVGDLVVTTAVFRTDPSRIREADPVVLVRHVRGLSIRYFGSVEPGKAPQWLAAWKAQLQLPQLVLIDMDIVLKDRIRHLSVPIPLHLAQQQ